MAEITITIADNFHGQLLDAIAGHVREDVQERIDEAVRGAIKGALDEALRALVDEKVRPVVDQVIAEGWQLTDRWGAAQGDARISLRDRISKAITEGIDQKDQYERKSKLDALIEKAVLEELKGDTGKAIAKAREVIRERVDSLLNAKLREAIGAALGVTP